MKVKYLILAHTDLHQVANMIESLKYKDFCTFYLHIDKKINFKEVQKYTFAHSKNVIILRNRFEVTWGGFSMVKATLALLKQAYKSNEKAYMILLSGQDFPIKPPESIYNYLRKNYGAEFFDFFPMPSQNWNMGGGMDRIRYHWFIDQLGMDASLKLYEAQKYQLMYRQYFENLPPHGGSQWWCITTECAGYILGFLRTNKIYLKFFETTYVPDEIFFSTIVVNSEFLSAMVNDNLRYIDWVSGPDFPKILTKDDVEALIASGKLWARKFLGSSGVEVLQEIKRQKLS